jgi:hypothetical protein
MNTKEISTRLTEIIKDEAAKITSSGKYCRAYARRQWKKSFADGMFRMRDKIGPKFRSYIR